MGGIALPVGDGGGRQVRALRSAAEQQIELPGHAPDAGAGVHSVAPPNSPQHRPPASAWHVLAAAGAASDGRSGGAQAPLARCASEQQNESAEHVPDAGAGPHTAPPATCRQHWPPCAARQVAAAGGGGAPGTVPAAGPGGGMGRGGRHWPLARCASEQQSPAHKCRTRSGYRACRPRLADSTDRRSPPSRRWALPARRAAHSAAPASPATNRGKIPARPLHPDRGLPPAPAKLARGRASHGAVATRR
jgi:hypothetical protein